VLQDHCVDFLFTNGPRLLHCTDMRVFSHIRGSGLFIVIGLAVAGFCCRFVQAQSRAGALPVFEAVSIKPNNSSSLAAFIGGGVRNGRVTSTNTTLKLLVQIAFQLQPYDITGGPAWLETDRYDIVAKTEDGVNPSPEEGFAMLQAMLEERFKLKFHRENREASV